MGLLDRIGKVLKSATESSPTKSDAPVKPETPTPPTTAAKPAAPSTTGLFGGTSTETAPAAPSEKKTEDSAPSTKGLFGGTDADAAPAGEPKDLEKPDATKGLFGAATTDTDTTAPGSTVEQAPPSRKLNTDAPSSTVPEPDPQQKQIMPVHPKVLMIVHNPPIPSEGNKRLTEIFKWHDADKNARGYIEDLKKVSGGYLNYEIVERIDADFFPPKADGFTYTPDQYIKVMRGQEKAHQPDWLDYHKRIEQFDLQNRFNNGDFDEVWFFSFPYAGEYESIMGGPGGFWCNAPAIKNTDRFKRRFVMMGFNFERGVDVMLENFGHRYRVDHDRALQTSRQETGHVEALHPVRKAESRRRPMRLDALRPQ